MDTNDSSPLMRLTVDELLRRWPQAARVFLRRRMACPGCELAPFETVGSAVKVYRIDGDRFLAELAQVVDESTE